MNDVEDAFTIIGVCHAISVTKNFENLVVFVEKILKTKWPIRIREVLNAKNDLISKIDRLKLEIAQLRDNYHSWRFRTSLDAESMTHLDIAVILPVGAIDVRLQKSIVYLFFSGSA